MQSLYLTINFLPTCLSSCILRHKSVQLLTASGAISTKASVTCTIVASFSVGTGSIHGTNIIQHCTLINVCVEGDIIFILAYTTTPIINKMKTNATNLCSLHIHLLSILRDSYTQSYHQCLGSQHFQYMACQPNIH